MGKYTGTDDVSERTLTFLSICSISADIAVGINLIQTATVFI